MANTFSRTVRSVRAGGPRAATAMLAVVVALALSWCAWLLFARVPVYATSESVRLEVDRSVHAVEASVGGSVAATRLRLGMEVEEGELLVELDARRSELALQEQLAELASCARQLATLREEIATEEQLLQERRREASAAVAVARAKSRQARAEARYARQKAKRWSELRSAGVVSDMDGRAAAAEAERIEAEVQASRVEVLRQEREGEVGGTEQLATLARARREAARIEGEMETARAAIARLEHEIELHRLRAPVSGRVGQVRTGLHRGSVVAQGVRLGSIVPAGTIRAVGRFPPEVAIGRIRPRQSARVRLDGFPWTQHGSLVASVRSVSSEPHPAGVRVELDVPTDQGAHIPLQHGLPGTAEVEVERVSPATLLLRAAAELLAPGDAAASDVGVVVLSGRGGDSRVWVEIARTAEQRNRGLMFRRRLDQDAGMLFVFDREAYHYMWMKNTFIPLDMIFVSSDQVVVGVIDSAPPGTMVPLGVAAPSRYVLEVNGGFAQARGIVPGTRVVFE